jgi:hypothetical protein
VLTVDGALAARSAVGGTAPDRFGEQLRELAEAVTAARAWIGTLPG